MTLLDRIWYSQHPARWLLWPLSWLFALLANLRRFLYRKDILSRPDIPVPVIVVGNISVGGTGKTPLTIWLCEALKAKGWRPGVVSRGYGGQSSHYPLSVEPDSDPVQCGDEPLLLRRRTECPLVVDPERPRAALQLLKDTDVNIIISDDGLQHYALRRDIEIAVVDGQRRNGNGMQLPAGPLRESPARLDRVDLVLVNGPAEHEPGFTLGLDAAVNLQDGCMAEVAAFRVEPVHAVAGIGNPERFFQALEASGLEIIRHPFADHYQYTAQDLTFADNYKILMTEKDAVKCRGFANSRFWFLPVTAVPNEHANKALNALIGSLGLPDESPN